MYTCYLHNWVSHEAPCPLCFQMEHPASVSIPNDYRRQQLERALARGYCSAKNSRKALDPDLIEAMTDEIVLWLHSFENHATTKQEQSDRDEDHTPNETDPTLEPIKLWREFLEAMRQYEFDDDMLELKCRLFDIYDRVKALLDGGDR